ncbi:MAG: hypothetical protein QG628_596 [Patescibacteria group bacterium]|nr:hypothetical protein [Patescibacteria group bacterium]
MQDDNSAKDSLDTPLPEDVDSPVAVSESEVSLPEDASDLPSASHDEQLDEVQDTIHEENGDTEQAEDTQPEQKLSLHQRLRAGLKSWWINKKLRYGTFAGIGFVTFLIACIPPSRYFVLNTVGVRSKASIVVVDDQSENPLKNVQVTIGEQTATTNIDGKAQLTNVKLGKQTLKVKKLAYAETEKSVTIGWGSNPLGSSQIKAVGAQYSFIITDWLSGKPVNKTEASAGEFDASSDEEGKLTLVVDSKQASNLFVVFKAAGYRDERVAVASDSKNSQPVKLVSYRKQAFISKRTGKYDLYKIDADGKNEKLVLPGTGSESDAIGLVSHPNLEVTAMTSSRDNLRNKQGYLLTTLTIVDLNDDTSQNIAQSEQIQIIGWSGDNLVYVQIAAGASASNPKRQRLVSYNQKTEEKIELASSNNFNDVLMVGSKVYYAQSNTSPGFYAQNIDSKNRTTLLDKETWNILRSDYDTLDISSGDEWYQLKVGDSAASKQTGQPVNQKSRIYSDSNDNERSIWVDERDGKGTLVLYDKTNKKEKILVTQAGLENPVRWLSNSTIIYRIRTQQEIADYVLNIEGGTAKKIRDVTPTYGVDRWYH